MTLQAKILASAVAALSLTLATALAGGTPWRWLILAAAIAVGASTTVWILKTVRSALLPFVRDLAASNRETMAAAGQIAASTRSLAEGAHEQEATIEQTTSSSSRLRSMTEQNSKHAKSAAEVMQETERVIGSANQTLGGMVTSMSEINAASDKIARIIRVIDEIAFQTNILALNAAVEAARAGEAGMGFAVVADEVRSLAQRSAQAARDTAAMIEESIAKSAEGSKNLDQVKQAILAITESASRVKTLVDEVSAGSQEQARGIGEIAAAIQQMEGVTHTAASGTEESAAAVDNLEMHAETTRAALARIEALVGGASEEAAKPAIRKPARPLSEKPKPVERSRPRPVAAPVKARAAANKDEVFPLDDDFR